MRNQPPSQEVMRLRRVSLVVGLVLCAFAFRLLQFQIIQAPEINKVSFDKRSVTHTVPAVRGSIVDAQGNVLARTVLSYDINVDPSMVSPFTRKVNGFETQVTVEQAAQELATLLKVDVAEISKKLVGTSRYANLKRSVDALTFTKIRALDIPWVFDEKLQSRVYPNGALAGNLLGFMGQEGKPLEGLELQENKCLAGVDGLETYEKGAKDGIKIPASARVQVEAKDGGSLILSINSDLQYFAQQVMTKYVRDEKADWGSAVVVEVKTGKILAAAESPSVDPNDFLAVDSQNRRSRIFQFGFEPGSTIKTLTAATAIDQGKASPLTQVKAPQSIVMPGTDGFRIKDSHDHPTQRLTLTGVLRDSSNTGIVQVGAAVPYSIRYDYWKRFGLGARTAVDFAGESSGIIHGPTAPDGVSNYTTMFGQAMSVTPIQTAFIYQTIANGGVRLSPQLILGCKRPDGTVDPVEKLSPPVQAISPDTAKQTIAMLEKVVEDGPIGRTAAIPGYRIAGKSGTAQIKDGNGYGYRYAISFIGMVPADNPKYVLAVTIYKPRTVSNSIGATPPFKAIMEQILHTYRIPPSTTKSAPLSSTW
ncbi:MAG: peptidoglycan D,D-transpeptidase FtsI family protein [Micrococcales bacterium]